MIEVHARERVIVFAGHGEWNRATAPALRAQLEVALAGAWSLIVIDLRDVSCADAAGVAPVADAVRQSGTTEQQVILLHPQPPIARLLEGAEVGHVVIAPERCPPLGELADALSEPTADWGLGLTPERGYHSVRTL